MNENPYMKMVMNNPAMMKMVFSINLYIQILKPSNLQKKQ